MPLKVWLGQNYRVKHVFQIYRIISAVSTVASSLKRQT